MPLGVRLFLVSLLVATASTVGATSVRADSPVAFPKTLSMGSGSNQYGNDPDAVTWPVDAADPPQTYPEFWGNIAGGGTAKQQGDAYAADWCDGAEGVLVTDGCSAIGNGDNLDYTPDGKGYYYTVDFTGSGPVNLQVFDPALVNVGEDCNEGDLTAAAALANVPGYPEGATNTADRATRYARVSNFASPSDPGWQYCTGDNAFPNSADQMVMPATTYTVLRARLPGMPADAVPVTGCAPLTFPGFTGDITPELANGLTPAGAPGLFSTYFRQWVTLCQVTGNPGDEYFIEVSTDNGAGVNHFSLRGETPDGSAAPVAVAGNGYMSAENAVTANQLTSYHLVRVPSAAAGLTLVVNLFDIGDASSVGSLQVLPPPDSNVGATFDDCSWSGDATHGALGFAANTPRAPWGTLTSIANCQLASVESGANWNGQWSTIEIPIADDYSCDDADPQGCWVTIDYLFAGGVFDSTSWNAYLRGAPSVVVAPPTATPGDGAVTLSWHSAANHGSPITGYVVTPYLAGVAEAPRTFATNASTDVVTGLVNGASYTFTVAAENAVGTGTASAPSSSIVVGVPLAPASPRSMRPASHTLRVSFDPAVK